MNITRKEFYLFTILFAAAIVVMDLLSEKGAIPSRYIAPGLIILMPLIFEFDIFLQKYFSRQKKDDKHGS
ncbi:hypothetical protein ACO0K0_02555 [Undibacterium sp. SXout11W]|uniref:hypothetical protein n=1 Tax=Undibacterium sp. SXout11W TaxID=3413050 RepID=UPI003BF1E1C9